MTTNSGPTITPNGSSGANAVAAITLKNGVVFSLSSGNTLHLQGYSSGNAIFLAGDGTAGEYIDNGGTVAYSGVGNALSANIDYLKVPVHNGYTAGTFKVDGNGDSSNYGSVLQVSGSDANNTAGVSFYQNGTGETDITGNANLWCVNDFTMDGGLLQTKDSQTEYLQVGTSGNSPVDGTVTLLSGTVNIDPGTNVYGKLAILSTTTANVPTFNVGNATLTLKVNMATASSQCDKLFVGFNVGTDSTGKATFGYNGGISTVAISPQGTSDTGHNWRPILFGTETGDVALNPPAGFTTMWENHDLLIKN